MRNQFWRKAAVAVAGIAAFVSAAHAQTAPPVTPAPAPVQVAPMAPAPLPAAGAVTGSPVLPVTPVPGYAPGAAPAYAPAVSGGGCATGGCATGGCGAGYGTAGTKSKWYDKCFIGVGTANPIGCGCHASDKTFFWGSCRQFFTPGKTCCGEPTLYNGCGGYCGGLLGKHGNCPLPQYAVPYGTPANNCCGPFTYLER